MTIFNRTDKPQDPGQPPAREAVPVYPEAKRAQAYAQPLSPPPASTGGSMASVISKALKITGQLESTEDIQIDGEIDGDVRGVGVKIGNNAKVKGTVYGDEVELSGSVEGRIEAKKVVLTGTARMSGDVVHQDVKIESGAFIDGHLKPEFGKSGAKNVASQIKPVTSMHTPSSTPVAKPAEIRPAGTA